MKNKLLLTAISFLANFVMAGFASQFGMLITPIANLFGVETEQVASIFSLLNGGSLAGTIAAFFLIDKLGIKTLTVINFSVIAVCALAMYLAKALWIISLAMTVIGLCGGIGLCIAGTIIVSIWQSRIQSSMLVIQDATFNVAGVVFPLITTFALINQLSWGLSYLTVGIVSLLTVILVLFTRFDNPHHQAEGLSSAQHSEWNFGIICGGIGLLLSMMALYTFLTWGPIFVQQKFHLAEHAAGNVITQYWAAALVGAVVSTAIVSRIKIQHFLLAIIVLAMLITSYIVSSDNLSRIDLFTYLYGFVCAALYNSFIAYGVSFLKQPSSKNVSYILISGSTGAMFSPAVSAFFVAKVGVQTVMYAIPVLYLAVAIMLISAIRISRNNQHPA